MRLLLIDGNNVVISCHFAMNDLRNSEDRWVGGLVGFMARLRYIVKEYIDYACIVTWDSTRAPWRLALYPEYKAGRPDLSDDEQAGIKWQLREAQRICRLMGVVSVRLPGTEADDIIAVLARAARKAIIYSSDRDFFQLVTISSGVRVHRTIRDSMGNDRIVDPVNLPDVVESSLKGAYRSAGEVRLGYGLAGDSGDNVPGVYGIGHGRASQILEVYAAMYGHNAVAVSRKSWQHEGLRALCRDDHRKTWRNVDHCWDDFLLSLSLTDLWRDDLLEPTQVATMLDRIRKTPKVFNVRETVQWLRWVEFHEELEHFGALEYIMRHRRKINELDSELFYFAQERGL